MRGDNFSYTVGMAGVRQLRGQLCRANCLLAHLQAERTQAHNYMLLQSLSRFDCRLRASELIQLVNPLQQFRVALSLEGCSILIMSSAR